MAKMIEHSNIVSVHELKRQWEDELVKEDDEKIKMGLTKKLCVGGVPDRPLCLPWKDSWRGQGQKKQYRRNV